MAAVFKCTCCESYQCVGLRGLLNHIYCVHSHDLDFKVNCAVFSCPLVFRKYNSFYKHIIKKHKELYNDSRYKRSSLSSSTLSLDDVNELSQEGSQSIRENSPISTLQTSDEEDDNDGVVSFSGDGAVGTDTDNNITDHDCNGYSDSDDDINVESDDEVRPPTPFISLCCTVCQKCCVSLLD